MEVHGVDKVLVEGVESLERYLEEHHVLCNRLKQGFLLLTKAKLRLPEHTLSEISYHEELQASRSVRLDSEGYWRLQNKAADVQAPNPRTEHGLMTLHHRRAGRRSQAQEEDLDRSQAAVGPDTLLWFSSLPPSDLRQAQKQFLKGLQAMVVAASSAQKVQQAVHGVMSARR